MKRNGNKRDSACRPRRILILSASVGAGHKRAAEAVKLALEQRLPHAVVTHVDVLDLTNAVFRKIYDDGYWEMAKRAPYLMGKLYDMLDHHNAHGKGLIETVWPLFVKANFSRLIHLLEEKWDLAISTHFLPAELIAHLRRRSPNRVSFPHAVVVTDYDVQGVWVNTPCEGFFVATPEACDYLVACGIDPVRIHVSGIPVAPVFATFKTRLDCLRKHGFRGDLPLILQMAGSIGFGEVETIYRSLQQIQTPVQICVVTGKNAQLKHRLDSLKLQSSSSCHIMGFTQDIDELMAAADILISKPGGLTTAEALVRGCPMLVVNPIPRQEERNSEFLLQNGCAIKPFHLETIGPELDRLLTHPDRLKKMKEAALRCGRPNAAHTIAQCCINLLQT